MRVLVALSGGPLHGYVYLMRNTGTTAKPVYAEPVKVHAGGKPVDPFGMPSPMWGDFDGDGDLDLLCGEFRDSFTYYENTGTRTQPSAYLIGLSTSGFHTQRGVAEMCWAVQSRRPATAEPCVPSTCSVSRSSRRTRTSQD